MEHNSDLNSPARLRLRERSVRQQLDLTKSSKVETCAAAADNDFFFPKRILKFAINVKLHIVNATRMKEMTNWQPNFRLFLRTRHGWFSPRVDSAAGRRYPERRNCIGAGLWALNNPQRSFSPHRISVLFISKKLTNDLRSSTSICLFAFSWVMLSPCVKLKWLNVGRLALDAKIRCLLATFVARSIRLATSAESRYCVSALPITTIPVSLYRFHFMQQAVCAQFWLPTPEPSRGKWWFKSSAETAKHISQPNSIFVFFFLR